MLLKLGPIHISSIKKTAPDELTIIGSGRYWYAKSECKARGEKGTWTDIGRTLIVKVTYPLEGKGTSAKPTYDPHAIYKLVADKQSLRVG